MPDQVEFLNIVAKSAGFGALVLALACWGLIKLYRYERSDRREAWKAHNELATETNKVLKDLTLVLESVKQEVFRGKK